MPPLGTIRVDVRPVTSIDEVLEPIADPRWGSRLARVLRLETPESGPGLALTLEPEWPSDLGGSLDVSLIHHGRTVDAGQLWLDTGQGRGWFDLPHLPRRVADGSDRASGWSLRFKGTPKRVLQNWSATRYWTGEIELPLASLIGRSHSAASGR